MEIIKGKTHNLLNSLPIQVHDTYGTVLGTISSLKFDLYVEIFFLKKYP